MTCNTAEITIELPHLRLAARVWGPEDGLPVLALHGWLDNAASFEGLAPLLPGCRIVALDHAGHGLSAHRRHSTYYVLDYVADALAAAAALGWSRYAMLGHSLGAGVAALCAGTYPERISRLALIEGLAPLADDPHAAASRLRTALDREARGRRTKPRPYASIDDAAKARTRATGLTHETAKILVRRALEPADGGWRWRTDARLRWPSRVRLSDAQIDSFLSAIRCPVQAIRAKHGPSFNESVLADRCACIRDLKLVQLAGGHHLHLDDPGSVAAVLAPFFAEQSPEANA